MPAGSDICFVSDLLSTLAILEPPLVECQDLLIPTRSYACVARIDLGLKSNPNDCYGACNVCAFWVILVRVFFQM